MSPDFFELRAVSSFSAQKRVEIHSPASKSCSTAKTVFVLQKWQEPPLLRKLCLLFIVDSSFCKTKHEEASKNQFVTSGLSGELSKGLSMWKWGESLSIFTFCNLCSIKNLILARPQACGLFTAQNKDACSESTNNSSRRSTLNNISKFFSLMTNGVHRISADLCEKLFIFQF